MEKAVELINISKSYKTAGETVKVLENLNLTVFKNEFVYILGPTGSGKTTLAKIILRLSGKDSGMVLLGGTDIFSLPHGKLRRLRPKFQYIYQNAFSSLNPKYTVKELISEAVLEHKISDKKNIDEYVKDVLVKCGLDKSFLDRYPGTLSGGQRQKVAIARAVALKPDLLICDEITSSMDKKAAQAILSLIYDLCKELKLTVIFITHDLTLNAIFPGKIYYLEKGVLLKNV